MTNNSGIIPLDPEAQNLQPSTQTKLAMEKAAREAGETLRERFLASQ